MRRVRQKVDLSVARERLSAYAQKHGSGPFVASMLAEVIWPGEKFKRPQGAGGAATRVLKKLDCGWVMKQGSWGWSLENLRDE